MQTKYTLQNNIAIHGAQIVVISNPDLLICIDAHCMDNPPHALDHSGLFAFKMGGVPEMDRILIAAHANCRAIAQESDCKDFRIVTMIDAFQPELSESDVIHAHFDKRPVTALPDDQLAFIMREGRARPGRIRRGRSQQACQYDHNNRISSSLP